MTNKNQFVKNINQLKKLIKEGHNHYSVILAGGALCSKKTIKYSDKTNRFLVLNHIDLSKQQLTEQELNDPNTTNIGKAIKFNSLIALIE